MTAVYAGSSIVAAEHRAHLATLAAKVARLQADLEIANAAGLDREACHIGIALEDATRLHDAAGACLRRHGIFPGSGS